MNLFLGLPILLLANAEFTGENELEFASLNQDLFKFEKLVEKGPEAVRMFVFNSTKSSGVKV